MIAFEILSNGKRLCLAGAGDLGVVTASISWARRKALPEGVDIPDWKAEELSFNVGGIDSHTDEYLEWVRKELSVGSEITLRVVEVEEVDAPVARYPVNGS